MDRYIKKDRGRFPMIEQVERLTRRAREQERQDRVRKRMLMEDAFKRMEILDDRAAALDEASVYWAPAVTLPGIIPRQVMAPLPLHTGVPPRHFGRTNTNRPPRLLPQRPREAATTGPLTISRIMQNYRETTRNLMARLHDSDELMNQMLFASDSDSDSEEEAPLPGRRGYNQRQRQRPAEGPRGSKTPGRN